MIALRAAALMAVSVGALGSVGLTLYAGRQNPSSLLILAFAIWVLSPFVLIVLADRLSTRWLTESRMALHGAAFAVALISLAAYAVRVMRPPKAQAAFGFVVVPPVCWFLVAGAIAAGALLSRRHSTS